MPAKSERPRVSVVVPVYNGANQISHCIEALQQQTLPADSYEIIIVNNASVDDTENVIKKYPVRLLYEAKRGPAAARNTGIRAAKADLIAFTDADCVPHEDWLEHLVNAMSDTICGAGGGIVSYDKEDLISNYIDRIVFRQHYNICHKKPPHITTASACFHRSSLLEIGLFDEAFPTAAGEDRDIGERLSIAGGAFVFVEKARTRHKHPQTLEDFYKQRFRHASGHFYAILKKHGQPSLWQILSEIDSDKLVRAAARFAFPRISKAERRRRLLQLIDFTAYANGLIWHYFMYIYGRRETV